MDAQQILGGVEGLRRDHQSQQDRGIVPACSKHHPVEPNISIDDTPLVNVDSFNYLAWTASLQRVSSPSRRNCFSISLVVNLFCLAFILLVFLLLCLFSSVLSAFAKDALVERDASLSPVFARISRRRRLFLSRARLLKTYT